jgi:hypothetical protein
MITQLRAPLSGLPTAASAELDALLNEVCVALQISETQYRNAEEKYQNVGRWLAAPESPIARLNPVIYPQGSMALQTTVRPWTDADAYDLDLVLQVEPTSEYPMTLYRLVERRLLESPHYREILEQKKRCLALNFTGNDNEFHMDILPARADEVRGGTCIEVPDKNTPERWQPSNPKGYRDWFERRATEAAILLSERTQEPLPENDPAYAKAVLKRAVQLMKRRRDLLIRDDALSPRSVVLTTLAGTYYRGERQVSLALVSILSGIARAIEDARPGRIMVCNPANAGERFCESFKTDAQYDAFVDFVLRFRDETVQLLATTSLLSLNPVINKMFGERMANRALLEHSRRMDTARDAGVIVGHTRAGVAGVAIGGAGGPAGGASGSRPSGPSVLKNTFYGE